MSVTPVPAGQYGGVSVYEGLSASNSVLAPLGSVPAGAGLPWEDEPEPVVGCLGNGGQCKAGKAKESPMCIGHTRSAATALTRLI